MAAKKRTWSFAEETEIRVKDPILGIFSEEPVDLDTFIHDPSYMNLPDLRLSDHQYNLIRHMEQVYLPDLYPKMVKAFGPYWKPVRFVNILTIQWGKGSGKDLSVQIAVARIAYLLLCLDNPQKYYRLAAHSDIHIINIAMNREQAKKAFFGPMSTALKRSPWFKNKIRNNITDQTHSIRLEKQIELISGHSLAENFEGLSPIVVVLDEISGFQSEEQKSARGVVDSQRTAEAVYKIFRSSAATRFPKNFKLAAISYPRYIHDPIQNLCAIAREDIEKRGLRDSRYYVDGPRATWDVNPRFFDYDYITIPEADIPIPNEFEYIENYERDAAEARAKYECRPERAVNRFIRNDSALAEAFPHQDDDWVAPIQVFYYWGIETDGEKTDDSWELANTPNWHVSYQFGPQLFPMEGAIYALHVDLAVVADRAGISMCHVKNWERREHYRGANPQTQERDYEEEDRAIVKVDFVTYFEADMQAKTDDNEVHPREIQINWARNLIVELRRRGFNIGLVTFDTYQSKDSIQMLERVGIVADDLSMDRPNSKPYATLRDVIYNGRIEGYHDDLLLVELEGLNTLPNGKIDHPPGGSKDLADALCGAVYNALEMGGDEGSEPEMVDVNFGYLSSMAGYEARDPFWGNTSLKFTPKDIGLKREDFFR